MKKKQYDIILYDAIEGAPNETCGLIGGVIVENIKIVKEVYLLKNMDASSDHFSMDPVEQLAAVKDLRKKGLVLLGNFHSHPETPSRPSEEDKRLAYDPNASYLIMSLEHRDKPVLKAFRIKEKAIKEEELRIVE